MGSSSVKVISLLGWCTLLLCIPIEVWAGRVRTVPTTACEMQAVSLMTGRSTVLRFPSPPKKVVLGNQNYFNVEFIDSDITLQPLGVVTSNLFVYGDGYTYGFIIKVNQGPNYDDLVYVRKRQTPKSPQLNRKPPTKPDLNYEVKGLKGAEISIDGLSFRWSEALKGYFTDFYVSNNSAESLQTSQMDIQLYDGRSPLRTILPTIFEESKIDPKKKVRARMFAEVNNKSALRVKVRVTGKETVFELKWKK